MAPCYQIIKRVAESGFSTIDHARDLRAGIEVALKRPLPGRASSAEQFQTEAHVLAQMRHENIVVLRHAGDDSLGRYLALEWIEGTPLDQVIRHQALNDGALLGVLRPLLHALSALHAIGLAHADLNASNIMLDAGDHLTLIDFGNASSLADRQRRSLAAPNIGSIHHMAPELFDGQPPDVRSDLYAIGIMAFQALTQRYPFEGDSAPQIITAHLRQARPPLPASALHHWVLCLLARDPAQRPATALEALHSLPVA